ncbi:hypothetical protein [Thalassospira marina]|uniref:SPOR domain-containing protein n=1 Tax=Thalassospira marina TaxID=2048283 RepID=A0A2N3KMA8_9PROT|nr:hypothetical protein [Thalassospira marina]PKR51694.1 hypothetical protein COO20_19205 [Thalassospira marina]
MKRFLIAAAPLFLSACGGSGDDTTLSKLADDLISYVTTGRTVAENQRALVAGQGCGTDASLFGNGDCKVGSGAAMGFVDRDGAGATNPLSGARSTTIYAVNTPVEDWSKPGSARLHPYQNSADIMIVAVPPAASQLDQRAIAAQASTEPADMAAQDNVQSMDIDDAPKAEMAALPGDDASKAMETTEMDAAKEDASRQPGGLDAAAAATAKTTSKDVRPPAPAKLESSDVRHKAMLPPAPAGAGAGAVTGAKAPAKAPLKGDAAGPDGQKQASGKDALAGKQVSAQQSAPSAPANGKYVVLGSFTSHKRAQMALNQYAQYHPQLIPATVEGTPYLRIAVGPMDMSRANDLRLVTAKNGVKDSWIVDIVGSGE